MPKLQVKVCVENINSLKHEFLYAIHYATFNKKVQKIAYEPNGIFELEIEYEEGKIFERYDAIIMQFGEKIEGHDVLTYAGAIPLEKSKLNNWFGFTFVDAAQIDEHAARILATAVFDVEGDDGIHVKTTGMSIEDLLLKYHELVMEYKQEFDTVVDSHVRSREDLLSLNMTTIMHRLGYQMLNTSFFNVSRDPVPSHSTLNYLLMMGAHYIGIALSVYMTLCLKINSQNKTQKEIDDNREGFKMLREAIFTAVSICSLMTPYGYDIFVNGKTGASKHGERFSNMRPPMPIEALLLWADDCEEDAKEIATLLYYIIKADDVDKDRFPFLYHANIALKGVIAASSLMLVKSANVSEASKTDEEIIAINNTTGHMAAVSIHTEQTVGAPKIDLILDKNSKLAMAYCEGTGNVQSCIEVNEKEIDGFVTRMQTNFKACALKSFSQRINMTKRDPYSIKHDPSKSTNSFYVMDHTVYPIHENVEDACVYICCNYKHEHGVTIADSVLPDGGAYLKRMPDMTPQLQALTKIMNNFNCPEFPLEITPLNPKLVTRVEELNAEFKKIDQAETQMIFSFLRDYHMVTSEEWDQIIEFIHDDPYIVYSDVELFGNIMETSVVIVRLFYKMS